MAQSSGIDFSQALKNGSRKSSRWPSRDTANRLEPECWPEITPSFKIEPGSSVFTIGSCFARHIDRHLKRSGFDVPAIDFVDEYTAEFGIPGESLLNKYTPPSVWQELSWTKRILDRDGEVTLEDIEPFLLQVDTDKWIDMHRMSTEEPADKELLLRKRRSFFNLYRRAFTCDVCIITLGLIEAWFDSKTGLFVEFHPQMARSVERSRLSFRRLNFQECFENVRSSIELLSTDPNRKILMTVSPIPIQRTFTKEDVIVANMRSKGTLRTVCGEIVDEYPNVDYFPSFESVILTRQPEIWTNDLVHVDGAFIGRIMNRVMQTYVETPEQRATYLHDDLRGKIVTLTSKGRYERALEIYGANDLNAPVRAFGDVHVLKSLFKTGDLGRARTLLDRYLAKPPHRDAAGVRTDDGGLAELYGCVTYAQIFAGSGDAIQARAHLDTLVQRVVQCPPFLWALLNSLHDEGDDDAIWMIAAELRGVDDHGVKLTAARFFTRRTIIEIHHERIEEARRFSAVAHALAPDDSHISGVFRGVHSTPLPPWLLRAADKAEA